MTQWYNKVTGELTSEKPGGRHYYDPDVFKEKLSEWEEKDDSFRPPVDAAKEKAEKVAALDAEYQPQFAELAQSLGVATLDGNQVAITGIKEDYAALKAEYTAKMEALA